jgi:hypothetical protein
MQETTGELKRGYHAPATGQFYKPIHHNKIMYYETDSSCHGDSCHNTAMLLIIAAPELCGLI